MINKKAGYSNRRPKKSLCLKKKAQPHLTQAKLAKLYGVKENTVSTILKKSSYWLTLDESLTSAERKRDRIAAYPVIEEALYMWVEHANPKSLKNSFLLSKAVKQFTE